MSKTSQILTALVASFLACALGVLFFPKLQSVRAAVPNMIMVYSKAATDNTPFSRTWNGGGFWSISETTATKVAVNVRQVVVKTARFKEESMLVTLDDSGYIAAQWWNGSTWSATSTLERLTTAGDSVYRPFDLEYETGTDRAILVTRGGDNADPVYAIWDGATWGATSTIDIPLTGSPRFIELARQPFSTSTKIAMIVLDANSDVYGMEWNGSSWSNMGITSAWDINAGSATKKAVDVAYESASGAALFAWPTIAATNDIYYKRWDGASFSASSSLDISTMGSAGNWVRLASNPYSATNTIMLGVQTVTAFELENAEWLGSAWGATAENDGGMENTTSMNFDVGYTTATTSGRAWVLYGDGATISTRQWKHGAWSSASVVTNSDDTSYIVFASANQNHFDFHLAYEDTTSGSDDIYNSTSTNGATTWTPQVVNTIWAGSTIASPVGFRIDMTHSRFFTYPTFTQAAHRFFENADSYDVGTSLTTAQDLPATTTSSESAFRLRMLLHDGTATSTAPEHEVVLQYASMSGSCDTGFSGESYATVTPSTAISFYDNASVGDGATMTSNASDPSHSGHTRRYQGYEEANGATTTTNTAPGEDAVWDFALKDNDGNTATNVYCFRLMQRTGAPLATYSVIPQIATYVRPTISAAYSEIFNYGGSASTTATLTVTDVGGKIISDGSDLRIPIATSSVNMRWDTSDTYAIFGGTASSTEVTSAVVSYEGGGSVLVVPVVDDFDAGDTLTISGLAFTSFNTATSTTAGALGIFAGGSADQTYDATTTATVAIRGTLVLANHPVSQISDRWDTLSATTTTHYRYKLTATGEYITMGTTTFSLSGISGVDASNFSYAYLYSDLDNNGFVNGLQLSTSMLPNAVGTYDEFAFRTGCSTPNYNCVDEDLADDDTTTLFYDFTGTGEITQTFGTVNSSTTGTIKKVRVLNRYKRTAAVTSAVIKALVYTNSKLYYSTDFGLPAASGTYYDKVYDWYVNPSTGKNWTWSEIDNLEVGLYFDIDAGRITLTQTKLFVDYCTIDCQVGGDWAGTVNISGSTGTVNFATSTSYVASSTLSVATENNYVLELAMTGLVAGDTMTIGFSGLASTTGASSTVAIPITGSADNVTHEMDVSNTAPSLSGLSFNAGSAINLIESVFKWATATLLITDAQYCNTLSTVTAKAYLASTSNTGTICSASDLSCYIGTGSTTSSTNCVATTTGNTCGASDTTVEYDCGFKFWYISTPTDTGAWASSIWSVSATATDSGALTGTATNTGQTVDINTLLAIDITPTISYGTVAPGLDTGFWNATTTATNTGNVAMDPEISGDSAGMVSGVSSIILSFQEYASSPFLWGAGTPLTDTFTGLNLSWLAPSSTTSPPTAFVSWGLGVPSGKPSGTYTGTNYIQAGSAL